MARGGAKAARIVRAVAWTAVAVPALWLAFRAATGDLGANPVEAALHDAGNWALRFLVASLAVTPLRRLGLPMLAPARRILGLGAFGAAVVHFAIYLAFDLGFALLFLVEDVIDRPYIAVGFGAFVILVALGITSTKKWQRKLGRRWNRLHALVYPAAVLSVAHFYWLVKADAWEPALYAGVLSLLFGFRIVDRVRARRRSRAGTPGAAAQTV